MYAISSENAVTPTPPEYWRPVNGLPSSVGKPLAFDEPFGPDCRAVVIYTGVHLKDLAEKVMADHGVTWREFIYGGPVRRLSYCRFDFMWRAYQIKGRDGFRRYSLPALGMWFEQMGRARAFDHTAVLHGIRKWNEVRRLYLMAWVREDNRRMALLHGGR